MDSMSFVDSFLDDFDTFAQPDNAPDNSPGTSTSVLEREETDEKASMDDGANGDRLAHYVSKERMEQSQLTGRPVVALCGKVWVPRFRADDYPVCPECKKIYDQLMSQFM